MGINRKLLSVADKITNRLDQKMIDYVSRYVYDDMTPLENAISIYLCYNGCIV